MESEILKRQDLARLLGISIATLRRRLADGSIPSGRSISKRTSFWLKSEVMEWLSNKASTNEQQGQATA